METLKRLHFPPTFSPLDGKDCGPPVKKISHTSLGVSSPVPVRKVSTIGRTIRVTDAYGKTRKEHITKCSGFELIEPDTIDLDQSVFGWDVEGLMPCSETREEYEDGVKKGYASLMASMELPVSQDGEIEPKAVIQDHTETAMFGCKQFPLQLIAETLKDWHGKERPLGRIRVTRGDIRTTSRAEAIVTLTELLSRFGKLTHVWKLSDHQSSIFVGKDITEYKARSGDADLVDMLLFMAKDTTRMATISLSDYAISIHFGERLGETTKFPVLKSAFAEATGSHTFFDIHAGRLKAHLE